MYAVAVCCVRDAVWFCVMLCVVCVVLCGCCVLLCVTLCVTDWTRFPAQSGSQGCQIGREIGSNLATLAGEQGATATFLQGRGERESEGHLDIKIKHT